MMIGSDANEQRPPSPDLPLVPGPNIRACPGHRRGQRDRTWRSRCTRARRMSTPSRSIRELAQIGRDFHPEGVYQDPRVSVHVNDGRAFMRGSTEQYDLIVFALTDSLTLVSSTGSVRLESFIYTEEALAEARDHLAPDGTFVMYNLYREPWLVAKLEGMITDVFGHQPLLKLPERSNAVLAAGPAIVALPGGPAAGRWGRCPARRRPARAEARDRQLAVPLPAHAGHRDVLPGRARVPAAVRRRGRRGRRARDADAAPPVQPALLRARRRVPAARDQEPRLVQPAVRDDLDRQRARVLRDPRRASCSRSSSTPASARRTRDRSTRRCSRRSRSPISCPADALLIDPPELRYALAALIAFAPVFFANLVFTYSFRDTASADMAFASNLLGAMVGGALEYVALLIGFQPLLLIVAVLYAAAFLLAQRVRLLRGPRAGFGRLKPRRARRVDLRRADARWQGGGRANP